MKFVSYHLFVGLIFLLCSASISAHEAPAPSRMAQYFPHDVDFFAVLQTDVDFIGRLDALFSAVDAQLPITFSHPLSVNSLLNQAVANVVDLPMQIDFMTVAQQAIGDAVAIGLRGIPQTLLNPDAPVTIFLAFEIRDYGVAQMLMRLLAGALRLQLQPSDGDYMLYTLDEVQIALSETTLHIAYGDNLPLHLSRTLADLPLFADGLYQLPDVDYDLWAFLNTPILAQMLVRDAIILRLFGAFDLRDDVMGGAMLGIVLREAALVVDVVQARSAPQLATQAPIDPSFWAYVPPQAQFFLHTTDLTGLVESATNILASISASDTPQLIMRDLTQFAQILLQADLQADILAWTRGDYLLWGDFDPAYLDDAPLYLGLILEATSPQNAHRLVTLLASAAQVNFGRDPNFSLRTQVIHETSVTFIGLPHNPSSLVPSEVAIGANDTFFFIATPSAVQDLLAPHDGYTSAIPAVLPALLTAPKMVVYASGDAVGEVGGVIATAVDPVRQFLFSEAITPEDVILYQHAFATLFPAMTLSAKAGATGSVLVRLVAYLETGR